MTKVLIADDEPILRESLTTKLLKHWPDVDIVATCESGEEALEKLVSMPVDVAFLDIQMGELSGIEVALKGPDTCHYVFITAYDQYAVSAFETGAVDYLLKPFSDQRLKDCIIRVSSRLLTIPNDLKNVLSGLQVSHTHYLKRLNIQIGTRIWLIDVQDVLYFQACGRYVKVITNEREALMRMTLRALIEQLDPETFWQIHRSIIINLDHLDHLSANEPEQLQVHLKGVNQALPVSRSFQHLFRA
ncbi:LytR/AlgR family response regulator transcription factor [Pseudoalteromonas sp. T1lg65]|uniref:LytR/AlgR family response regulator transcription factor n=1 Tax=Pseudoalteromonas sp. T1lg65 TaxID=2077101 RepID=UPI003F791AE8